MTPHRDSEAIKAEMVRFVELLFEPNDVFEIRVFYPEVVRAGKSPFTPKRAGFTLAGRAKDMASKIAYVAESKFKDWGQPTGVYITPQQSNPAILDRCKHLIVEVQRAPGEAKGKVIPQLTSDTDIVARRFLLVDVDPSRPKGRPANGAERAAAQGVAGHVRAYFTDAGWPPPVVVDSGNGVHLYYRLPADEPGGVRNSTTDPIAKLLRGLNSRFGTSAAKIDTSIFNPSRIMRLPGTMNCKGAETTDRPFRPAVLVEANPGITAVNTGRPVAELVADLGTDATVPELVEAYPAAASDVMPVGTGTVSPDRIRKLLATIPPAIEGKKGSDTTLWAAQCLTHGFLLPESEALAWLIAEYNPRCLGPWEPDKLARKVSEAIKHPLSSKPRGWLLNSSREAEPMELADDVIAQVAGTAKPATATRAAAGPRPESSGRNKPVEIWVDHSEFEVNNRAVEAIAKCPDTFQRGARLVRIVQEPASDEKSMIFRPAGPRIAGLPLATLRERLTRVAEFWKKKGTPEGDVENMTEEQLAKYKERIVPPDWCIKAVHERMGWAEVRRLDAVVDHPVIRPDGSILDRCGYDVGSRLFIDTDATSVYPADRRAALALLLSTVADFPFKSDCHKSAWLAALFTPLARFAFPGPSPLFLFEANVPGAGKGLLCNAITHIVTGRNFPTSSYAHENEEMGKRITGIALAGDRMILLDNIEGPFGNQNLCAALTTDVWKERQLGVNDFIYVPLFATWYATGNNVVFRADMARRVCHVRLESPHEKPEERSDFRHPNLRAWIAEHRAELLGASLSILSEYIEAGRPDQKLKPFGDYIGWSDLVRSAIVWAGMPDPLEANDEMRENADTRASSFECLLHEWEKLDPKGEGLTAAQIIELAYTRAGSDFDDIRAALDELAPKRDVNRFGYAIRANKGRRYGGRYMDRPSAKTKSKVAVRWAVFNSDGSRVVAPPTDPFEGDLLAFEPRSRAMLPPADEPLAEEPPSDLPRGYSYLD